VAPESPTHHGFQHITPRIAVIIPLYNGEKYIAQALDSVFAQRLKPAEIVVVNDGSTDGGAAFVEELAARYPIRVLHKANGGQSSARNYGVAHTTSDLIALLDQDDVWYPNHLEQLVRPFLLNSERELGWVYSNLDEIDEHGRLIARCCLRFLPLPNPKRDLFGCLAMDMFVLPSASLISRKAFEEVGGFDETLSGYEDDDLFRRIFLAGYDNFYIDEGLARWRIYSQSASYSPRMAESRMLYFRKLLSEFPDDPRRDRYFARDFLAPRFFPAFVREYTNALRYGDRKAVRTALDNLVFVSRRHKKKARIIMMLLLPFLRIPFLPRTLLPVMPGVSPMMRRLLR
jgi:glycosyltransferase involved in cell wall biosynthesis